MSYYFCNYLSNLVFNIYLSLFFMSCFALCLNVFALAHFNPEQVTSVQFSSVAQLCPTLCDLMNPSMPGLPVHHQLPEFTQTHVHWVGDAIQPSHPLSSPFPLASNPSQHQSLFQWVNSEVRNRFKGLDLIDRVPDELWMEVHDIVLETGIKTIHRKEMQKQNGCLGRPYK